MPASWKHNGNFIFAAVLVLFFFTFPLYLEDEAPKKSSPVSKHAWMYFSWMAKAVAGSGTPHDPALAQQRAISTGVINVGSETNSVLDDPISGATLASPHLATRIRSARLVSYYFGVEKGDEYAGTVPRPHQVSVPASLARMLESIVTTPPTNSKGLRIGIAGLADNPYAPLGWSMYWLRQRNNPDSPIGYRLRGRPSVKVRQVRLICPGTPSANIALDRSLRMSGLPAILGISAGADGALSYAGPNTVLSDGPSNAKSALVLGVPDGTSNDGGDVLEMSRTSGMNASKPVVALDHTNWGSRAVEMAIIDFGPSAPRATLSALHTTAHSVATGAVEHAVVMWYAPRGPRAAREAVAKELVNWLRYVSTTLDEIKKASEMAAEGVRTDFLWGGCRAAVGKNPESWSAEVEKSLLGALTGVSPRRAEDDGHRGLPTCVLWMRRAHNTIDAEAGLRADAVARRVHPDGDPNDGDDAGGGWVYTAFLLSLGVLTGMVLLYGVAKNCKTKPSRRQRSHAL